MQLLPELPQQTVEKNEKIVMSKNQQMSIPEITSKRKQNVNRRINIIKTKLCNYLADNNTAKDKLLLESHAHCFILLS